MLPDSPWRFLLFFGEPNVKWCEAQFASWVTEPANTWSNLAFIFAGLVMLPFAKGERSLWLRLFGPSMLVLGVWSGLYHASFTFFFQVFDFLGMFLVLLCPLCIALERLGRPVARPVLTWLAGSLGLTALMVVMTLLHLPGQLLVVLMALGIVGGEFAIWRQGKPANRPFFLAALSMLVVGETFSALDVTRNFCHPDDHLVQGHAFHHVMVSLCFVFTFFYCRQMLKLARP